MKKLIFLFIAAMSIISMSSCRKETPDSLRSGEPTETVEDSVFTIVIQFHQIMRYDSTDNVYLHNFIRCDSSDFYFPAVAEDNGDDPNIGGSPADVGYSYCMSKYFYVDFRDSAALEALDTVLKAYNVRQHHYAGRDFQLQAEAFVFRGILDPVIAMSPIPFNNGSLTLFDMVSGWNYYTDYSYYFSVPSINQQQYYSSTDLIGTFAAMDNSTGYGDGATNNELNLLFDSETMTLKIRWHEYNDSYDNQWEEQTAALSFPW